MQLILYAPGKPTIQPEVFSTCFLLEVRESTFQIAIYSFKRSIPPVSPSNFSFYLLIENISSASRKYICSQKKNLLNSNEYIYLEIIYNEHEFFFVFVLNIIIKYYLYIYIYFIFIIIGDTLG